MKKGFTVLAAVLLTVVVLGCTSERFEPYSVQQPGAQQKDTVILTPIRDVIQNPDDYAGEELVVNGTLFRQKSGSLYFWYVVDPMDFSLSLDYTNEIGDAYDASGESIIMLRGDVYLTENLRAAFSITEIITPDYSTTDYVITCIDGTLDNMCSSQKPLSCESGVLVEKASVCGCPSGEVAQDDTCISEYEVGPVARTLSYFLDGNSDTISITVYSGLDTYLSALSGTDYLDEEVQSSYLDEVLDSIESKTTNKDDQARIAVNLVQAIPLAGSGEGRYPYEVLYDNQGTAAEKSRLIAFLLREMGFGVAFLTYETEDHTAVGIECHGDYDHRNTGYCFIEPSTPAIISDDSGYYVGVVTVTSAPEVTEVSGGTLLASAYEDYVDAQDWEDLGELAEQLEGDLEGPNYDRWLSLVNKYGIVTQE